MNQRNVEALTEIFLRVHLSRTGIGSEVDTPHAREVCRGIAEGLAAAGVLVPSAISPKQMRRIGQWIENETAGDSYDDEAYRVCVGLLRSVATGDALIETDASR